MTRYIFSASLQRGELSRFHSYITMPSPSAVHSTEHFPRNPSALTKMCSLRHVTSPDVLWVNLFSNKRTPMIRRITMSEFLKCHLLGVSLYGRGGVWKFAWSMLGWWKGDHQLSYLMLGLAKFGLYESVSLYKFQSTKQPTLIIHVNETG